MYPNYNPYQQYAPANIAPYQQRIAELEAHRNAQNPPMQGVQHVPAPMPQAQPVRAILVTSIDEARAYNVLDGARYIFSDTSNGKLYIRQFNVTTGMASFDVYERTAPEAESTVEKEPSDEKYSLLEKRVKDLEARINESAINRQHDAPTEPTGAADDAAATGDAVPRTAAKRNSK